MPISSDVNSSLAYRACDEAGVTLETTRSKELVEKAKILYSARRRREDIFGKPSLFADPAWDIMLGLYIDEAGRGVTQISAACIWSSTPMTTALRWIDKLVQAELLTRTDDPFDGRRSYVGLSRETHERISTLLGLG